MGTRSTNFTYTSKRNNGFKHQCKELNEEKKLEDIKTQN